MTRKRLAMWDETLDRRSLLRLGATSALWLGLGSALRPATARAAEVPANPRRGRAKACILLYMEGGPSQIDTWDPKPGRPTGGSFAAIESAVSGIRVSEHLPLLAARMKQLAVLRSVSCKEGNHARARHLMHTGYPPQGGAAHPALGALVAQAHGPHDLPGYVAIAGPGESAGLLGAAWSPFPVRDPGQPVRFLEPPHEIDPPRLKSRVDLRSVLDESFAKTHASSIVTGERAVEHQAVDMMRSPRLAAFSFDAEDAKTREAYGDTAFGHGCLLARRLVESGVSFVEVTQRGWDTHKDNFGQVKTLSGELDRGMSALLDDLVARGLLDSTLVVWMGDFGRTPAINLDSGRDHYPQVSSVVLAGAGLRTGQAVGATDADGLEITERPLTVPDLFQTLAFSLGLDPEQVNESATGRPIKVVDGGQPIQEVI